MIVSLEIVYNCFYYICSSANSSLDVYSTSNYIVLYTVYVRVPVKDKLVVSQSTQGGYSL